MLLKAAEGLMASELVRVLADEADSLSSVRETHTAEGEKVVH